VYCSQVAEVGAALQKAKPLSDGLAHFPWTIWHPDSEQPWQASVAEQAACAVFSGLVVGADMAGLSEGGSPTTTGEVDGGDVAPGVEGPLVGGGTGDMEGDGGGGTGDCVGCWTVLAGPSVGGGGGINGDCVGVKAGDEVGWRTGGDDGAPLGATEGFSEGDTVGFTGDSVGEPCARGDLVGGNTGGRVGNNGVDDGATVGVVLGTKVGEIVGDILGGRVGEDVGDMINAFGDIDGESVGVSCAAGDIVGCTGDSVG